MMPSNEVDLEQLLSIQLLIARAAQSDSLAWWDDNSLTSAGAYMLVRIFPNDPLKAGMKMALGSAKARHEAIFADEGQTLHLYSLGDEVDIGLHHVDLGKIQLRQEPIASTDELAGALELAVGHQPNAKHLEPRANRALPIRLAERQPDLLELAKALAWGYCEGKKGKPVYPYLSD